ncbi:MAG: thermonuclease family protein [Candidatus Thiodiazotropha weberae]|uniref:thermonuclease family protein n=1 Tax=Candidatus Thiodiazotropha endoloripes TaxID=1818881 RepID=UPI001390093A|nr:thermonuclease family protein [Candidatus Thiodiazotropha endoloripes]MCG7897208.1 thermonuclease family protein [Candidatus Thiodiazotropha weberae]
MAMQTNEKAPQCGAFLFALLFYVLVLPLSLQASGCLPCNADLQPVERVIDGDTLLMRSGDKLRLIGINTPELGHWGKPGEPGGQAAKALLQRLVRQSDGRLALCPGVEKQDRYGRHLVHLSNHNRQSIAAQLLRQGAGWAIAVPPNLFNNRCYFAAEFQARREQLGIWKNSPASARSLKGDETGFHHLRGRIIRVGESRSAVWMNLEGGLALRITWKDWKSFQIDDPHALVGRNVEARGWLYKRKDEQRLRIRHPSSLHLLD